MREPRGIHQRGQLEKSHLERARHKGTTSTEVREDETQERKTDAE